MSEPVDVYPYPVIKSQPNSSHSNGSYGLTFIVLGGILIVSVVSCVLGRLMCSGRRQEKEVSHHHQVHQPPPPPPPPPPPKGNGGELGPKEWEEKEKPRIALRERGDVEYGFGRGMPPPRFDGGRRPEVRFADNV